MGFLVALASRSARWFSFDDAGKAQTAVKQLSPHLGHDKASFADTAAEARYLDSVPES
jgi:hypothetical protein